ncbi:hypothetical protein FE257_004190 [Aspergillus nanangensis]|uniref:Copper-containing nitrite reductase n=1 Tax=Aspergillus nanangensis TaxID=2582783 RepID=A0AAD4CRE3_ASPNN|nr:hypothetical protein FE257_004190 [Aspergillus nanangensis]
MRVSSRLRAFTGRPTNELKRFCNPSNTGASNLWCSSPKRLSTVSSNQTGHQGQSTRLKYAILLSTSAATSWFLYARQQGTVYLEGKPPSQEADPKRNPRPNFHLRDDKIDIDKLPKEKAILTTAPDVPPHISRDHPVLLQVDLETTTKLSQLTSTHKYEKWTFNDSSPGPFIRARVGDVIELSLTNRDESGNPHNIDSHGFLGPGGGASITTASEGETKTAHFKVMYPGLFIYHCAAAPVPVHIANGMYGLIYVQPEDDLPPVDREYYVMQSEFYHEPPEKMDNGRMSPEVEFSYPNAQREEPSVVVFNGHEGAVTTDKPLKARLDETVRIFFGNAGPNLTSSFHVIGSNFHRLYRDGDVTSPPGQFVSTTPVPPGGATIADMKMVVPGTYTLVDHAIFRIEKGAIGYLNVSGPERPDFYGSDEPPNPCVGCKLHP